MPVFRVWETTRTRAGGHAPACHYLLFCSPAVAPNTPHYTYSHKIYTHMYTHFSINTLETCGIHAATHTTQYHEKITLQTHTGQTTSGTPCTDSQGQHATTLRSCCPLEKKKHLYSTWNTNIWDYFLKRPRACKVDIKKLTFAIIDNW